jgi:hypothetical protein
MSGADLSKADDDRAIREVLALYCMLLDDRRFEDWGKLFAKDAEWTIPWASFRGQEAIVQGLREIDVGPPGWCKHISHFPVIRIESASRAYAWSDLSCYVRDRASGEWSLVAAGRYYDELEKAGGQWRFKRRRADIDEGQPAITQPSFSTRPLMV